MLDWLVSAFVLVVGMEFMITGWIVYLYIAFLVYLFLCIMAKIATSEINTYKTAT